MANWPGRFSSDPLDTVEPIQVESPDTEQGGFMCATGREAMRIIRHVILGSLIFVLSCAPAASAASQTRSAQSHALVPPESSTIGGPIAINDLATTSSSITVSAGNRLVVDVDVWVKFNGHTEPDDVHLALKSPAAASSRSWATAAARPRHGGGRVLLRRRGHDRPAGRRTLPDRHLPARWRAREVATGERRHAP